MPGCPLAHPFAGERTELVHDYFRPVVPSELAADIEAAEFDRAMAALRNLRFAEMAARQGMLR